MHAHLKKVEKEMEKLTKILCSLSQNSASLAKITTLVGITILFFRQDFLILFIDALGSETNSHILAIPPLIIYLIYRKRKVLKIAVTFEKKGSRETKHLPTTIGVLLLTIAVLIYWYGSYTFTPLEFHVGTLPIFIAGLMAGRLFYARKKMHKFTHYLIVIGFLLGYLIGSYSYSKKAIITIFLVASILSYYLHNKGYVEKHMPFLDPHKQHW